MEREAKTKVVASVWGADFVQFLAALAVLPRSLWKNRMKSTVSSLHPTSMIAVHEGKVKWGVRDSTRSYHMEQGPGGTRHRIFLTTPEKRRDPKKCSHLNYGLGTSSQNVTIDFYFIFERF